MKVFEVSPVQHAFLAFVRGGQPSERRACEWLQARFNGFRVYVKILMVCPQARIDLSAKQTETILQQEIQISCRIYARYVPSVKVVDKASWDTFAVPNVKPSCTPPSQYAKICQDMPRYGKIHKIQYWSYWSTCHCPAKAVYLMYVMPF